ncbi:FecR family protein [Aliarcobacter vitoriensis]|uniref:FecR family protein n=1 Tax=Aliarcobacter vitoriensis TaxID=2011099 RepID=UPI00211D5297|nr:FecR family protein [Aliarcobacter vitoriensis]
MKKLFIILFMFSTMLFANIGTITLLEGEAYVQRKADTFKLNFGDKINEKDRIETKVNSKIQITFIDNTIITIGKESSLDVEEYLFSNNQNASSNFSVTKGAFHVITGQIGKVNPSKFKLKTKNASIGIRGTEFLGDQTRVFCASGAIFVESFGEIREVTNGNYINTFENQIPSQSMPTDTKEFEEVDSQLNTNSLSNNQTPNFNTDQSSPLALNNNPANNDNPILVNIDSHETWGYWNNSISDEKNLATLDKGIVEKISKNNSSSDPNPSDPNPSDPSDPSDPNPSDPNPSDPNPSDPNPSDPNPSDPNPSDPNPSDPASTLTDLTYIQNLLNGSSTTTLNYLGSFFGENITNVGSIELYFDIGGHTNFLYGSYSFEHSNNEYNGEIFNSGSALNLDSRDNTMFFESMSGDTRVYGQFYGSNMDSVKGNISNFDPTNIYESVNFSANKQP